MSGYGNLSDGRRPEWSHSSRAGKPPGPKKSSPEPQLDQVKLQDVGLATCRGTALTTFSQEGIEP